MVWATGNVPALRRCNDGVALALDDDPDATTTYADRASARGALAGGQRQAANRFFRSATSKSTDFRVTKLSRGRYRLEFFSPARNLGYGKHYVQEIGPAGEILREYKETLGPAGIIETKWIHGAP